MNARLEVRTLRHATACVNEAKAALYSFKPTPVPDGVTDTDKELIGEEDRIRLTSLREALTNSKGILRRFVYRAKPCLNAKGRAMRP